jgi:hypothetical protein
MHSSFSIYLTIHLWTQLLTISLACKTQIQQHVQGVLYVVINRLARTIKNISCYTEWEKKGAKIAGHDNLTSVSSGLY